jgi:hypothetical protein
LKGIYCVTHFWLCKDRTIFPALRLKH